MWQLLLLLPHHHRSAALLWLKVSSNGSGIQQGFSVFFKGVFEEGGNRFYKADL